MFWCTSRRNGRLSCQQRNAHNAGCFGRQAERECCLADTEHRPCAPCWSLLVPWGNFGEAGMVARCFQSSLYRIEQPPSKVPAFESICRRGNGRRCVLTARSEATRTRKEGQWAPRKSLGSPVSTRAGIFLLLEFVKFVPKSSGKRVLGRA